MRAKLCVIAVAALVSGGCNRPDTDQATAGRMTSTGVVTSSVTPPAAPERGPIPPDANAVAPGTNASLAFAESSGEKPLKVPPSNGGGPEDQHVTIAAQDAAAKAPDTAAADAAKRKVYAEFTEGATASGETVARASIAPPSARPESGEMPTADKANGNSTSELDKPST